MKNKFKAMLSLVTVGVLTFGGATFSSTLNQQTYAVYDRKLRYDPDAEPNYDAVHDLESLHEELHRLHWFSACRIAVGRFAAKGFFGIVPPNYKLCSTQTTTKWTLYKTEERTFYYIVKEYDNEIDACKAFLRAVQKRAKQRLTTTEWWWRPEV